MGLCILTVVLLLAVSIDGHVLKSHQLTVPPEGLTFEINIKPEVVGKDKKQHLKLEVVVPEPDHLKKDKKDFGRKKDFLPTIENRHGIRVGRCPDGYVQRGGFCFPDYDY